jgi:hypothetical protein
MNNFRIPHISMIFMFLDENKKEETRVPGENN